MKGMERTLLILKPDAVKRGLMGAILSRIEARGLRVVGMKMMVMSRGLAAKHYAEHKGKWFVGGLIDFITSGPVVPLVVEGKNAVDVCRAMMGPTLCSDAAPGTIRGDYALSNRYNLVHGSDSVKNARREIKTFFKASELCKSTEADYLDVYDFGGGEPL